MIENFDREESAVKNIQLLISTTDNKFLKRQYIPPFSDYLVINQCINLASGEYPQAGNIINDHTIGLSKSRNKALQKASADICLISDDDTSFFADTPIIIQQAFAEHPNADIITFQYQHSNGSTAKRYAKKTHWHTTYTTMAVSSIEIAFKRNAILNAGLQFDEKFGLGAKFPTGEENIFLLDALKKGLKILYVPIPIVIHPIATSGTNLNNRHLVRAKGAMFYRMFGHKAYLLCLLFSLKKHYRSNMNCYRLYCLMLAGIKTYRVGCL